MKNINNIENQELADKQVKLRPSQKQLLEQMKLANKESLADVLDRILEEREELSKKVNQKFNKTTIVKHSEVIKNYLNRIIEMNLAIEKEAQDIINLEIKKYSDKVGEVEEAIILLADTMKELNDIKKEHGELIHENEKLHNDLNNEIENKNKLEEDKSHYLTQLNETISELNRLSEQNTDLKIKNNEKNNEIAVLTNSKNNLETIIATKETEINNWKILNKTLDSDKKYLQESLNKLNEKLEKLENKNIKIFSTQKEVVELNFKLESKLRDANNEINELKTKFNILEIENKRLVNQIKEREI